MSAIKVSRTPPGNAVRGGPSIDAQHPHRSGIHREAPRLSSRPEQSPEMLVLIMAAIVAQLSGSAISQEEADSKNHPNQHNG